VNNYLTIAVIVVAIAVMIVIVMVIAHMMPVALPVLNRAAGYRY
jgi:hypothetical protein